MAGRAMNKASQALLSTALILSLPALTGCGAGKAPGGGNAATEAPLAGARIGGDFTLIDQNGRPAHWRDYRGKYPLVYFGYTYCPDVCPVDLQNIIGGLRRFEKQDPARAAKVQPLFITVDPGRDTPAVLKPWVGAFHPRLIGLTGTTAQIEAVKKSFAVVSSIEGDAKSGSYLVSHSRTPYFFGPDGGPIALVPVDEPGTDGDEGSADAVAAFLNEWVK
jgi:protein SCO1/2